MTKNEIKRIIFYQLFEAQVMIKQKDFMLITKIYAWHMYLNSVFMYMFM